jgi:hypothetical protein
MKINLKSIFISGTVAGLVIIIIGGCLVPIIGNQMDEVLKNRLLPPLSIGAMIFFAVNSIIMGIGVIGLYSLIKNLIKSQISAILATSIIFWFFVYFLSSAALVAYGFMPPGLTIIGTSWGLIEVIAGVFVGSKLYREVN